MPVIKAVPPSTSIDNFFQRAGLGESHRIECFQYVKNLHPEDPISYAPCQGYCSLTIFVGNDKVLQFRPSRYQLDLQTTQAAQEVYGIFAPSTRYLGKLPSSKLLVYSMTRIPGVSLQELHKTPSSTLLSTSHRARLCQDFALFLSKSWHHKTSQNLAPGPIGVSLRQRLNLLTANLPTRFRDTANHLAQNLHLIAALPWVLTHGDLVPGNLILDPSSSRLLGLVDWAEAEILPFGINLYGLEELLGQLTPKGFQYRRDAPVLRAIFWRQLAVEIPALEEARTLRAVRLARDLGVLLWYGIAFDDGAIDRVVEEGRDVAEVARLDAFLEVGGGVLGARSKL